MEKTKLVKVSLTFVNKKGEQKTVGFEMDEKYFKDLQHPSITAKQREECMLAEYRMYCKEKKIKRKTQSINSFYKQDGELLIDSGEEKIKTLSIIHSTARELHSFVIQANSSKYGDNRITVPSSTNEMNLVSVKGGLNCTLHYALLDLKELLESETQMKEIKKDYSNGRKENTYKSIFKKTSAGFKRIEFEEFIAMNIKEDLPF